MRTNPLILAAALTAALSPVSANATRYVFDLTGSRTAHFALESTKPNFFSDYQTQFQNVRGNYGGAPGVASAISFGATLIINAVDVSGTSLGFTQFSANVPSLFTGPTSNPVFTVGTFALSGIVSGNSSITIAVAAPVAEPGGFMLLAGAVGATAYAVRRRARATT